MSTINLEARRPDNRGRVPWNKGKLVGQKPPLKMKEEVWRVRFWLQQTAETCDLTLFDLAIDSKLRGCDLVHLKVDDIADGGPALSPGERPAREAARTASRTASSGACWRWR